MNIDSTRVKIDLDAISANFDAIQEKVQVPVMAVVKADAYGHGAIQVARFLQSKCAFLVSAPCWKPWNCGRQGSPPPS